MSALLDMVGRVAPVWVACHPHAFRGVAAPGRGRTCGLPRGHTWRRPSGAFRPQVALVQLPRRRRCKAHPGTHHRAPNRHGMPCQQVAANLDDLANAPAPNFIASPARPGRPRPRRRLMGGPWAPLEGNRRCILLTAVRVACSQIWGSEGSRKPNSKLQDTWQVPVEPLA